MQGVIVIGFFAALYGVAFDIIEVGKRDSQKIAADAILTFIIHVLGVMALVAIIASAALVCIALYRRLISWLT
jgi:hypothetical protein